MKTGVTKKTNVTPLGTRACAHHIRHVFIRHLTLDAEIGVHAHEQGRKQTIHINVDLAVSDTAHGDQLSNVVCYEQIVDMIRKMVDSQRINLVETLAENIAEQCLSDPRILTARVRVEKPEAVSEARSVGVEIERTRQPTHQTP